MNIQTLLQQQINHLTEKVLSKRFADTIIDVEDYDGPTNQVFIRVVGLWDDDMWEVVTEHLRNHHEGICVGIYN